MNDYLIPANTKRGQLILGLFYPIDLMIVAIGVAISLLLLVVLPIEELKFALIAITPGLVCAFLVIPVAYYHNIRQLITEMILYLASRKRYMWKGWCFLDESEYAKSNSEYKQQG